LANESVAPTEFCDGSPLAESPVSVSVSSTVSNRYAGGTLAVPPPPPLLPEITTGGGIGVCDNVPSRLINELDILDIIIAIKFV
jgi:hypothetical protein